MLCTKKSRIYLLLVYTETNILYLKLFFLFKIVEVVCFVLQLLFLPKRLYLLHITKNQKDFIFNLNLDILLRYLTHIF